MHPRLGLSADLCAAGCRLGAASLRGRKAQGTAENAISGTSQLAVPNPVRSYDFTSARTRYGANSRILNVVHEYTCVGCRVARSIGAGDVVNELERLFAADGRPQPLRSDNGREFIAASLQAWLAGQTPLLAHFNPGTTSGADLVLYSPSTRIWSIAYSANAVH